MGFNWYYKIMMVWQVTNDRMRTWTCLHEWVQILSFSLTEGLMMIDCHHGITLCDVRPFYFWLTSFQLLALLECLPLKCFAKLDVCPLDCNFRGVPGCSLVSSLSKVVAYLTSGACFVRKYRTAKSNICSHRVGVGHLPSCWSFALFLGPATDVHFTQDVRTPGVC